MCMTVFYILWGSIEQRYSSYKSIGSWGHSGSISAGIGENRRKSLCPIFETDPTVSEGGSFLINNMGASKNEKAIRMANLLHERRHVNKFTIDCGKSTTGLFFGIFVLLLTIISLITYFIYKNSNSITAIKISEITELFLIIISTITVVTLYIKFKLHDFNYKPGFSMDYNETLIIVGLAGIYLFGFYSIIAIINEGLESEIEVVALILQIVSIFESTLQSILIIDCMKMYTKDKDIKKFKPGRSLLTLLILVDVSLWLSETFSVKKYEMNTIQLDYYDIVFWSIVSSISSPLGIFFRFHASVCLSDVWKTLYE